MRKEVNQLAKLYLTPFKDKVDLNKIMAIQ
jgi:hypothetical protein